MGRFLLKISCFGLLGTLVFVAFYTAQVHYVSKRMQIVLPDSVEIIIAGHSHADVIMDTIVRKSSNTAQGGQAYLYTYLKVEQIIRANPQVNTLLIEFTNNHVHPDMNDWFYKKRFISARLPIYSAFFRLDDYLMLARKAPIPLLHSMMIALRKNSSKILRNSLKFEGKTSGSSCSFKSIIDKDSVPNDNHQITNEVSEVSLNYLRRIVDLCRRENVKAYLIRSPQHRELGIRKTETNFIRVHQERFSDVDLLDFNNLLLADTCYADYEHLNCAGSRIYSTLLNELIHNEEFVSSGNKDSIIAERIKSIDQLK